MKQAPEGAAAFLEAMAARVERSRQRPFASAHEAFAVLLEEVDEAREIVWQKPHKRDAAKLRAELLDVAVVCARWAMELPDGQ